MTREEAIEILRNNVCNSHHVYDNVLSTIIEALAVLVPELRENEDERIREWLVNYFKAAGKSWIHRDISPEHILAYLEKQKEQKPIFRVGDTIIAKDGTDIPQEAFHIERIEDGYYWDKEGGSILIGHQDEFQLVEQKPAEWSEEDEHAIENCEYAIKETFKDEQNPHRIGTLAWLKFLRPQYHGDVTMTEAYKMGLEAGKASSWKPSEEQMKALWKIMKYAVSLSSYYNIQKEIESLYNDLNKLK